MIIKAPRGLYFFATNQAHATKRLQQILRNMLA